MGATNLGCRECGAAYELDASYVCSRCFGPLEVVYDLGLGPELQQVAVQRVDEAVVVVDDEYAGHCSTVTS